MKKIILLVLLSLLLVGCEPVIDKPDVPNIPLSSEIDLLEDFDVVPIGNFNLMLDDYLLDIENAFIVKIKDDTLYIMQLYPLRTTTILEASSYENIKVVEK